MARVLIIDDNAHLRNMIKDILGKAGYDTETACDGMEACKLAKSTSFDLVITDILMPEKEGIQTIIDLRHAYPNLKIIGMSGGGGMLGASHCLEMAQEFGANTVMNKPFGKQELLDAVASLIGPEAQKGEYPPTATSLKK